MDALARALHTCNTSSLFDILRTHRLPVIELARSVRGYFIDGGSRDAEEIIEIGFPVFCRYTSPKALALS